jgi:hypothetical protein
MDENKNDMKMNMDKNKEDIQKPMEELKKSMSSMIFHALDERLHKGDIKMKGIHKNKENKVDETQSQMGGGGVILSLSDITNSESQNDDDLLLQDPHYQGFKSAMMNYFILKIDMRKFDWKYPITWIFKKDQFFDIHQTSSLQNVPIASLYLENHQFVWYQCI